MIDINGIESQLYEIQYMAEFAAELANGSLDAKGAQPGYFQIETKEGNQLVFCCCDILRRIEELHAALNAGKCS